VELCIFCPNPRTTNRGEHVFDDWLNREFGKPLRYHYQHFEYGSDDTLIRQYPKREIDIASDVVCDTCNNNWMSEITTASKAVLEGFIRYERAATLLELGILTVACFAFMKAAVLDAEYSTEREPFVLRSDCTRFRRWMTGESATPWLPNGLQIWIAWYRRERQMETRAWVNGLNFPSGMFHGYKVLYITYSLGAFVLQLTLPRWTKYRRPRNVPFITQATYWDVASTPIWPNVPTAVWPPTKYLDYSALENFVERFRTVAVGSV
jgi:hypothetical protein